MIDFTTFPVFIAHKNVSQTGVSPGAVIAFANELLDTHNAYNPVNSRFTAPFNGVYQIQAEAFCNGGANTGLIINASVNGVVYARSGAGTGSAFERSAQIATLIPLQAGDYVEIKVTFIAGTASIEGATGHLFSGYLVTRS